jgi:hypothetical protein
MAAREVVVITVSMAVWYSDCTAVIVVAAELPHLVVRRRT